MKSKIVDTLDNIEYLLSKQKVLHYESIICKEGFDILCKLEELYSEAADLYTEINDNVSKCIVLVKHADILIQRYSLNKSEIDNVRISREIEQLIWVLKNCTDIDIRRSTFVLISRCYFFIRHYILAEKYIQDAFNDYDYSVSTFQLYMEILDSQTKYEQILTMMKTYLNMSTGYHRACFINDFNLINIMQSPYADKFIELFDNC